MYKDETLQKYLDDFAAKKSTPGGGSAAALCGALGVSALLMAANFSVGKTPKPEDEEVLSGIITELEKARCELIELVDRDAEAYAKLRSAMKEKQGLEEPARESFGVPYRIAQLADQAIKKSNTLIDIGNKYLVSDVGCGAAFLEAAFQAAALNCNMNLALIKDEDFVQNVRKELAKIGKEIAGIKNKTLTRITT